MVASTVGLRRTDLATLRDEEVRPDAALAPLLDYAFLWFLVIRQAPKLWPEGKGGARRCLTSSVCCSMARAHQFSSSLLLARLPHLWRIMASARLPLSGMLPR